MADLQSRKEINEKLKFLIVSHSYPNYISQYKEWQKFESPDFINIKEKIGLEITCSDAQEYCEWNAKRDKPEVFRGIESLLEINSAYEKKCKKLNSNPYQKNIKLYSLEKMFLYIACSYHVCLGNDKDSVDSQLEYMLDDFTNYKNYCEFIYDCVFVELFISDTNSNSSTKCLICFDLKKNEVFWEKDDIRSYEISMFDILTKNKKVEKR